MHAGGESHLFASFEIPAGCRKEPSEAQLQEIMGCNDCTLKWSSQSAPRKIIVMARSEESLSAAITSLQKICGVFMHDNDRRRPHQPAGRRTFKGETPVTPSVYRLLQKTEGSAIQAMLVQHRCSISEIDEGRTVVISGETDKAVGDCESQFAQLYLTLKIAVIHEKWPIPARITPTQVHGVIHDLQEDHHLGCVDFRVSANNNTVIVSGKRHDVQAAVACLSDRLIPSYRQGRGAGAFPERSGRQSGHASRLLKHRTPSGIVVEVMQGDITKQNVDVIVNAANTQLQHLGGLALLIARVGGSAITRESRQHVQKHGVLRDGEVACTSGGNLNCKYVVHAVGPIWDAHQIQVSRENLQLACQNSLQKANILKAQSIAIPAISSGVFRAPLDECAEQLLGGAQAFCRNPPRHCSVILIRFVLYDQATFDAFEAIFSDFFPPSSRLQ